MSGRLHNSNVGLITKSKPHTTMPNRVCGHSSANAARHDSRCASRACPPHFTVVPNIRPIMKIVVRIVVTAPCRNEKTSSISALARNRKVPP